MHLPVHLALTGALIIGAKKLGYNISNEIALAAIVGGVLIDLDKISEAIANKKTDTPDITARCRFLHSAFVWPFGLLLSLLVSSSLPFLAVMLHIAADSFIPGVIYKNKQYSSHSKWKWLILPWPKDFWHKTVTKSWPVTYEAKFNWIYTTLSCFIGEFLFAATFWLLLPKIILNLFGWDIPLYILIFSTIPIAIMILEGINNQKRYEKGNSVLGMTILLLWLVYLLS